MIRFFHSKLEFRDYLPESALLNKLDKSWCSKSNVRILKIHPVPSQRTTIQAMASIGAFRGQCRRRAACCLFQKSQLVSVHTLKRRGGGGAAAAIIAKTRAMPCRGLNAFELSSSGNALPLSSPTHRATPSRYSRHAATSTNAAM